LTVIETVKSGQTPEELYNLGNLFHCLILTCFIKRENWRHQ
jgi:hypothetical protein